MSRPARFVFTKLVVADEERMAAYYAGVYGLDLISRVEGMSASGAGAFREVILGRRETPHEGSLVIICFPERPAPRDQECILGFLTDDLDELAVRITASGGRLSGEIRDLPEHGLRVVFSTDPEGHVAENVQVLGQG